MKLGIYHEIEVHTITIWDPHMRIQYTGVQRNPANTR